MGDNPKGQYVPRLSESEGALMMAGFEPHRHKRTVKLVRRLLWPFIRPFLLHNLRAVERLEATIRAELASLPTAIPVSSPELEAIRAQLDATPRAEDVSRLVWMHTRVRSEVVALTNRHAAIEERAGATLDQADTLRHELERRVRALDDADQNKGARLSDAENVLANAQTRLDMVSAEVNRSSTRLDELGREDGGLFLTTVGRRSFLLKAGELISETVRHTGQWDTHISRTAERAAATIRARPQRQGALAAIDVGAHFGLVTVSLADHFERVISFEPNTFNAALLRANVLLNGLGGAVEIQQKALGRSYGTVSLAPSEQQEIPLPVDADGRFQPAASSNLGAYSFVENGSGFSEAPIIPLDALGYDDIGFIKVDAQGADGTVLFGGLETIARCQPWLVFEWEDALSEPFGISLSDVIERLEQLGYTLHKLHRHTSKQVDYLAAPQDEAAVAAELAEAV